MPVRYTTVLFDLDHTLLDSDASEAAAFDATLRAAGSNDPSAHFAMYDEINKRLWASVERGERSPDEVKVQRFRELIDVIELDADPASMAQDFVVGLASFGELYPGAQAVLDQLVGRVTLALITNGLSYVQRSRLERLDLAKYFSAVAISAEVGSSKPHRGLFDVVFDELGLVSRSGVVIVGDSLTSDMQGGFGYGIDTCWFNPHGRQVDRPELVTHEIRSLADLPDMVLEF